MFSVWSTDVLKKTGYYINSFKLPSATQFEKFFKPSNPNWENYQNSPLTSAFFVQQNMYTSDGADWFLLVPPRFSFSSEGAFRASVRNIMTPFWSRVAEAYHLVVKG